jgi:hypothetical protein
LVTAAFTRHTVGRKDYKFVGSDRAGTRRKASKLTSLSFLTTQPGVVRKAKYIRHFYPARGAKLLSSHKRSYKILKVKDEILFRTPSFG